MNRNLEHFQSVIKRRSQSSKEKNRIKMVGLGTSVVDSDPVGSRMTNYGMVPDPTRDEL
jgi:hypothetical protein